MLAGQRRQRFGQLANAVSACTARLASACTQNSLFSFRRSIFERPPKPSTGISIPAAASTLVESQRASDTTSGLFAKKQT